MENIENILKKKTKVFFDCEFTGLHQGTTLISLGAISECGKTFYSEFTDYDKTQIDDWLKDNVIKKLTLKDYPESGIILADNGKSIEIKGNTNTIKEQLENWLSQFEEVEMWSDCLSYDWVLFCQIWGHAFNVPKNIYYIPFDICTVFKMHDIDPDISREEFSCGELDPNMPKHNALWDAKIIRMCYEKLRARCGTQLWIAVNDEMPKNPGQYLGTNGSSSAICSLLKSGAFYGLANTTHWMYVPELPTKT